MTFGRSFVWGIASSVWAALVTFATVPFLLRILGLEAYGVIGFFLTLQALLQLLDLGMTPTISRQVARATVTGEKQEIRNLLHSLAVIYWLVGATLALLMLCAAGFIATGWLNSTTTPRSDLTQAIVLMGVALAARWPSTLYIGALTGAGRLPTVSAVSMAAITFANLGALLVLTFVSPTLQAYFIWQAGANLMQTLALRFAIWRTLKDPVGTRFDTNELRKIWRFSAGMTGITLAGLALSQLDKVLLSSLIPLTDFANYVMAALVAGLLSLLGRPMFQTVYPRLSALVASGDEAAVARVYLLATRLIASLSLPVAMAMIVYARDFLFLWIGSEEVARRTAPALALLAAGTALNVIMHLPFALQIAYGRIRLALGISVGLAVLIVPLIVALAFAYGAVGGALAWLILHIVYVFAGTWLTHRSILPGRGVKWLFDGVAVPLAVVAAFALIALLIDWQLDPEPLLNLLVGAVLVGASITACLALSADLREAGLAAMPKLRHFRPPVG